MSALSLAAKSGISTAFPLKKLRAIFRIYLRECFAYPAASFLWVLADAQTAMILPAVWLATSSPGGLAGGMTRPELITYYIGSMILSQFITCHLMWDIAWDIREGDFSAHLLRPIHYFRMNLARNVAWRVAKLVLFLPMGVLVFFVYHNVGMSPVHLTPAFFLSVLLAQLLSYVAAFCMAMTALWTTEFMSTLRLYYLPEMLLSGRLVPLSALPVWALGISRFTHFRYMIYFPTQMLMGNLSHREILQGLALQVFWIVAFLLLGHWIFDKGTKQYSGFGN